MKFRKKPELKFAISLPKHIVKMQSLNVLSILIQF